MDPPNVADEGGQAQRPSGKVSRRKSGLVNRHGTVTRSSCGLRMLFRFLSAIRLVSYGNLSLEVRAHGVRFHRLRVSQRARLRGCGAFDVRDGLGARCRRLDGHSRPMDGAHAPHGARRIHGFGEGRQSRSFSRRSAATPDAPQRRITAPVKRKESAKPALASKSAPNIHGPAPAAT